jgi:hypothetical protein
MTQHSKGPWDAPMFEHPIGKFSITGGTTVFGKPFVIAWVNDPETAKAGEAMANRDLIMAAPDMAEALVEARTQISLLQSMRGIRDTGHGTLSIIDAALQKAGVKVETGEEVA